MVIFHLFKQNLLQSFLAQKLTVGVNKGHELGPSGILYARIFPAISSSYEASQAK
jgi:hypothetical protein